MRHVTQTNDVTSHMSVSRVTRINEADFTYEHEHIDAHLTRILMNTLRDR